MIYLYLAGTLPLYHEPGRAAQSTQVSFFRWEFDPRCTTNQPAPLRPKHGEAGRAGGAAGQGAGGERRGGGTAREVTSGAVDDQPSAGPGGW